MEASLPLPLSLLSRCVGLPTSPVEAIFEPDLTNEGLVTYGAPFAAFVLQHTSVCLFSLALLVKGSQGCHLPARWRKNLGHSMLAP